MITGDISKQGGGKYISSPDNSVIFAKAMIKNNYNNNNQANNTVTFCWE